MPGQEAAYAKTGRRRVMSGSCPDGGGGACLGACPPPESIVYLRLCYFQYTHGPGRAPERIEATDVSLENREKDLGGCLGQVAT